jgi:hypothetical protein
MYNFLFFSAMSGQGEIVEMEKTKPVGERKFVPMWPDFDPDSNMFNYYKKAGSEKLWAWVDALLKLKLAGLDEATPHSIRSSACIWALRCYIFAFYVQSGGRWEGTGKSWKKYLMQGSKWQQHYARKGHDPIFHFWVWKYNVCPDYDA